jgi:hypothetical protein
MNDTEIQRLAHAANALRPDWSVASLRTWLTRSHSHAAYHDVARALAWVATDPSTRTPKRMDEAGPWWPRYATAFHHPPPPRLNERCPTHLGHLDNCPGCRADQIAGAGNA